jgi:hypothetical protein
MTWVSALRSLQGNKVGLTIEELHRAENDLVVALLHLADQHKVEHDVFYVARDIAGWSRQHVRELARAGHRYGVTLDEDPDDEPSLLGRVRQKGSELTGRLHEPGLLLLADLRHVHRMAAGTSVDWEVLAQAAQALKDTDLLAVAERCHPQTLRQMRWANAKIKETASQVIVTG